MQQGFTLIELMVTVAIIAVLAAIAIPLYSQYIATSREGVLVTNISTIEVFQEDVRLRTGAYVAGTFDVAGGNTTLADPPLRWSPQSDDGTVYQVVLDGGSYRITATDTTGVSICRRFPEKTPC
jgi:type IV pilus assembly protein PilE